MSESMVSVQRCIKWTTSQDWQNCQRRQVTIPRHSKKKDNLFRDCPLMTDDAFLALSLRTSATLAYFTSTTFRDAMNLLLVSTDSENTRTR